MRLNLLYDNAADCRSGYLNVDPAAPAASPDARVRCELHDLSALVDANEAEELVAMDILDRYTPDDVDRVLNHWLSRLSHGATITVGVVDVREVARNFLSNNLNIEQVNLLLHAGRQCALTMEHVAMVLVNKGLKLVSKRVSNCRAVVTCQRS